VFVREELRLALPVAVARERILTQLRTDGLQAASAAALELGRTASGSDGHRAGDSSGHREGTVPRPSPHLSVHTLPANTRGHVTVIPIRWFVDDMGHGQPLLDVNLEVAPAQTADTTLLLLDGLFRPITSSTDQGLHQQSVRRIPRDLLATIAALVASSPASHDAEHPM
jgi:hypothetical protein